MAGRRRYQPIDLRAIDAIDYLSTRRLLVSVHGSVLIPITHSMWNRRRVSGRPTDLPEQLERRSTELPTMRANRSSNRQIITLLVSLLSERRSESRMRQERRGLRPNNTLEQLRSLGVADNILSDSTLISSEIERLRRLNSQIDRNIADTERFIRSSTPIVETMAAMQENPDPPESIETGGGSVNIIDLQNGVRVNWAHPSLIPVTGQPPRSRRRISTKSLNPVFALAMVGYLQRIKNMGVVCVFIAGTIRDPVSTRDPHPSGRAIDIVGFAIEGDGSDYSNGHILRLRGGFPEGYHRRYTDRNNYVSGPSDWFNETDRIGTVTYRDFMISLIEIASLFFGQIIGPGHNQEHMTHFHIQLEGYSGVPDRSFWPATPANPTPYNNLQT